MGIFRILFGKHDVDMFALDSNAMVDYNGVTLEYFTPMSSPFSAGIDAFSQYYVDEKNYYAFPPYSLIPAVIRFAIEEKINCTLIFPQFVPTPMVSCGFEICTHCNCRFSRR